MVGKMSLKCSFKKCLKFDLAQFHQIAFYQDIITNGWNLALGPEFLITGTEIPKNIRLVGTGDERFPYNVICVNCLSKVGTVNSISGFNQMTANFSRNKVVLMDMDTKNQTKKQKWSKIIDAFPSIRRITPSIPEINPSVTVDTVHFHSVSDMDDIIDAGQSISLKSGLEPKDYQWRAFCFSCFNNILLCLPTGMGKTLIAVMLLKANRKRNESKAQVFIVPTVVLLQCDGTLKEGYISFVCLLLTRYRRVKSTLINEIHLHCDSNKSIIQYCKKLSVFTYKQEIIVEQQASAIEKTTDLKVVRRSSANLEGKWSEEEVCVCTPAMLVNAIKKNEISMSHLSLLIFDEVHEANSPKTAYGQLECPASQRPRVLGLTASPCSNSSNMREDISALCNKLGAVPYNPLQEDSIEKPNSIRNNL
ncbi:Dicer-like protein 1 [Pseudolycoriella hygida]|uniref:Dicer-like protein 1 n=1 Tax=Pseudolycoriella hygida TaxID=35572 RepID=A0A9Q0S7D7_9DIPT|nr:Dicer-like protein 1 [Pseudolycoriella hygida]